DGTPAWPAAAARPPRQYVYPGQGQSAQQQADDEYACHGWAVGRSGHDPVAAGVGRPALSAAEAEADTRAVDDYLRARAACLEGRGYTVR
ncbi:MAG: hypothetical protein RLY78_3882, partial [Pseudomonadota bacterium]